MTNFEYILKNMSERDLASIVTDETRTCFLLKIYNAFYHDKHSWSGCYLDGFEVNEIEVLP